MIEHSYWLDTAPDLTAIRSAAPLPARVDAAVVGAGYTGLSAARRLARSGASVVVIDREHAAWGASSRNAGQVLTGLRADPADLVARFGETRARTLFERSLAAIATMEGMISEDRIDCAYARTGHVLAASRPAHTAGLYEAQRVLGRVFQHRVHVLDARDQHTEIGSPGFHGVLVDERSAAVNPAQYAAGLAQAVMRAGALLMTSTDVRTVSREADGWRVTTSHGDVHARDVVMAVDAYADQASPELQRRLIPIGSFTIVTAPLDAALAAALLPKRRMAFDSLNFLHYFRLTADNRLLFGGRAEFGPVTPDSVKRAAAILERDMAAMFPSIRGTRIDYAWGGRIALPLDQMPRAGRIDGRWFAAGYGGHGIAMATHLGDAIARRMCGETISEPLFDDEWKPIPLYNGTPWFLPLVGMYYKVRDALGW